MNEQTIENAYTIYVEMCKKDKVSYDTYIEYKRSVLKLSSKSVQKFKRTKH